MESNWTPSPELEAAIQVIRRVAGEGGVLEQLVEGSLRVVADSDDRAVRRVERQVIGAAEELRRARSLLGAAQERGVPPQLTVDQLAGRGLAFNRKERFFTGTVLPMIIAGSDFANIDRFLTLCGLPTTGPADPVSAFNLQFFTEYGFVESLVGRCRAGCPVQDLHRSPSERKGGLAECGHVSALECGI